MTLYGLDLLQDRQGKYHLLEINGVLSGMKGFEQIYGDDRVQQTVHGMLEQRYGKITVNDGSYARAEYKKKSPLKYLWKTFFSKDPLFQPRWKVPSILFAPTARISWMLEKTPVSHGLKFPFEPYVGQESAVISAHFNEELPHPLVNPFLTEAIAYNKFFTYRVLKDSEIKSMVPQSTLLGLGFTHEEELEEIVNISPQLIIKPLLGSRGRGIEVISRKNARQYCNSRGIADFSSSSTLPSVLNPIYVEDLVAANDFSFEHGLGIIQPFIDSSRIIHGEKKYTSIRSIVCNERFVDAYMRVSDKKKVNLSQGAFADPCSEKEKEAIASLSEKIVAVFEERCVDYQPNDFKRKLYEEYIESRGRTGPQMREEEVEKELTAARAKFASNLSKLLSK